MKTELTPAQERARAWLPADGSWRTTPGRLASALISLSRAWEGCVEAERAPRGPRGGWCPCWRFTAKGVEVNRIAAEVSGE